MWKKEDDSTVAHTADTKRAEAPGRVTERPPARSSFATIGPSIVIRGEVTGDEDLLIQGQVDGSVALGLHSVTVGDGGRVKAGITGRVITVEGSVEGDLSAEEQIILRGTARVRGDLNAPRVVLEDGATFRGLVDMGSASEEESSKRASRPDGARGVPASERRSGPESASVSAAGGTTSAREGDEKKSDKTASETQSKKPATG